MGPHDWRTVHDAPRFAEEIVQAARDTENPEFRLSALARQALAEWNLRGAEQAIQRLADPTRDHCDLWTLLARRYLDLGAGAKARAALDRAHQMALALELPWQRGEALEAVATLLRQAGEVDRARPLWEEAIAAARESGSDELGNASNVLAEIAEELAIAGFADWAQEVAANIPAGPKGERAVLRVRAIVTSRSEARG